MQQQMKQLQAMQRDMEAAQASSPQETTATAMAVQWKESNWQQGDYSRNR